MYIYPPPYDVSMSLGAYLPYKYLMTFSCCPALGGDRSGRDVERGYAELCRILLAGN